MGHEKICREIERETRHQMLPNFKTRIMVAGRIKSVTLILLDIALLIDRKGVSLQSEIFVIIPTIIYI